MKRSQAINCPIIVLPSFITNFRRQLSSCCILEFFVIVYGVRGLLEGGKMVTIFYQDLLD
jgi:hypothetical protein